MHQRIGTAIHRASKSPDATLDRAQVQVVFALALGRTDSGRHSNLFEDLPPLRGGKHSHQATNGQEESMRITILQVSTGQEIGAFNLHMLEATVHSGQPLDSPLPSLHCRRHSRVSVLDAETPLLSEPSARLSLSDNEAPGRLDRVVRFLFG
jgi:hypothetical protein